MKKIASGQDGSDNDLLNWQNRRQWRPARERRITTCPPIDNRRSSGIDNGGARAPPEFEGSEERQSQISAYWSFAITASTSGFEKLSTALRWTNRPLPSRELPTPIEMEPTASPGSLTGPMTSTNIQVLLSLGLLSAAF